MEYLHVTLLNHLLRQSDWALPRLMKFSGKTVCFDIRSFVFSFIVQQDGSLQTSAQGTPEDARCTFAPSLLPRLALQDERAFAEIAVSGNAALLSEIFFLARHLRWDAAEDMSHIVGDIAAERLANAARQGWVILREGLLNASQAASEYWTEERPLLAKPTGVTTFVQQVDQLRDDLARLEQRIQRIVGI